MASSVATTAASAGISGSTYAALLAAIAALISALIALVALWIQERRARRLLAIELLFKFDDRFHADGFRQVRASAAKALQGKAEDYSPVDDVLDFFEMMGLLARRKSLDLEMVWSSFFNWLDGYWNAASGYIRDIRSDEQIVWDEAERLYHKLRAVERKKTGCTDSQLIWSREHIDGFLESETSVVNQVESSRRQQPSTRRKKRRNQETR